MAVFHVSKMSFFSHLCFFFALVLLFSLCFSYILNLKATHPVRLPVFFTPWAVAWEGFLEINPKLDLSRPPTETLRPPALEALYALYFAGTKVTPA